MQQLILNNGQFDIIGNIYLEPAYIITCPNDITLHAVDVQLRGNHADINQIQVRDQQGNILDNGANIVVNNNIPMWYQSHFNDVPLQLMANTAYVIMLIKIPNVFFYYSLTNPHRIINGFNVTNFEVDNNNAQFPYAINMRLHYEEIEYFLEEFLLCLRKSFVL